MMLFSPAGLLPLTLLAFGSLFLVLLAAFFRRRTVLGLFAFAAVTLALASAAVSLNASPVSIGSLFLVDPFARFFLSLVLLCSAIVTLLALSYSSPDSSNFAEMFPLLTSATLGAAVIICSNHFITFFIGLEVLSVSIFVLAAYLRTQEGLEAGFKYLVLSSTSTAFLLFGIALIYLQFGSIELSVVFKAAQSPTVYFYAALALVLVAAGFKLGVVPFHMWTPDIYQGAPAPISAFIATVSKGALFAFVLRYLAIATGHRYGSLSLIITVVAIASMFIGNILGLLQNNVKRLLAYSSIAQAGYVLVAFQAGGAMAVSAASFYLAVYFMSILGAFGVISLLTKNEKELQLVSDYQGLARLHPFVALAFSIMLFSLAGIPLSAGFVGKFYLFSAGVDSSLWILVFSLAASSVIGLYYYLRVIITMYGPGETFAAIEAKAFSHSPLAPVVLAVLSVLVVAFGVFPSPLLRLLGSLPR